LIAFSLLARLSEDLHPKRASRVPDAFIIHPPLGPGTHAKDPVFQQAARATKGFSPYDSRVAASGGGGFTKPEPEPELAGPFTNRCLDFLSCRIPGQRSSMKWTAQYRWGMPLQPFVACSLKLSARLQALACPQSVFELHKYKGTTFNLQAPSSTTSCSVQPFRQPLRANFIASQHNAIPSSSHLHPFSTPSRCPQWLLNPTRSPSSAMMALRSLSVRQPPPPRKDRID
jgi:hypothetical protein